MDELPLLELFTRLREAGMPLGIKDYELALRALQGGYGLAVQGATPVENRAALARLCRTLWVRSPDEQRLLDVYFDQLFSHEATPEALPKSKRRIFQGVIVSLVSLLLLGAGVKLWLTYHPLDLILKNLPSQPTPSPVSSDAGSTKTAGQHASITPASQPSPLPPPPPPPIWIDWSLPLVLILGVGGFGVWGFVRGLLKRGTDPSSESEPNTNLASELLHETEDEIQLAQAVRQLATQPDRSRDRFVLSADYLPVTQRQMKQSWRHLRRMVREGLAVELDVEMTVRQIASDGLLLEPKMISPRVNRTELVLLLDQDGSMVPFHSLSVRLAETAQRGGRLGQAGIYYFHNCPVDYLYTDAWHQEAEPTSNVLAQLRRDRTVVLIFSDAGAARGGLNFKRVSLTIAFLRRLKQHVRYVTWVNPMPKTRWAGTTAGEIARYVPMFEGTRQGLDQSIDVLRGRNVLNSQLHEVTQRQGEL